MASPLTGVYTQDKLDGMRRIGWVKGVRDGSIHDHGFDQLVPQDLSKVGSLFNLNVIPDSPKHRYRAFNGLTFLVDRRVVPAMQSQSLHHHLQKPCVRFSPILRLPPASGC